MRLAAHPTMSGRLIRPVRWLPLLATVVGMLGCEPTPHYAIPEEPLAGTIEAEANIFVTGAGDALGFLRADWLQKNQISISVPAEAYPRGTNVTIRLLANLSTHADTGLALGMLVDGGFTRVQALQLLPAALTPTVPLHVALIVAVNPWTFDVLYAREDAPAWVVVGSVEPSPSAPNLSFDIDAPGLWTIGQLPLPPTLQGHLQRVELVCGVVPVSTPRVRALDVVRNSYRFSSPAGAGCEQVDSGTLRACSGTDCLVFDANLGMGGLAYFMFDPSAPGLSLHWDQLGGPSKECPGGTLETEYYVIAPSTSVDAGARPIDASCSPDAAGGSDGGV